MAQSDHRLSGTSNIVAHDDVFPPGFGVPWGTSERYFRDPAHGDFRLHSDTSVFIKSTVITTFPAVQPKPTAQPGSDPRTHGNDPGAFMRQP